MRRQSATGGGAKSGAGRTHQSSSLIRCSPIAVFGTGLILVQIAIFHVGIRFSNQPVVGNGANGASPFLPQQKDSANQNSRRTEMDASSITGGDRVNKEQRNPRPPLNFADADAEFLGFPLKYTERERAFSTSHCIGENYQNEKAWMQRSCKFSFFCFDVTRRDFVIFQPPKDETIYEKLVDRPFMDVSQSYMKRAHNQTNTMSIGGINQKWTWKESGIPRLEWSPRIQTTPLDEMTSFYELPSSVVMAPFHSLNGANPGHLVWDDFLPIYTLLTMFQLDKGSHLLMMRYVLSGERGLWASCDWRDDKREACKAMQNKFLPLMVGTEYEHTLASTADAAVKMKNGNGEQPKSSLVCSRHAVVGIGGLTDHGTDKSHGWDERDYATTHNHGRGGMLYDFRNFMLTNIGVDPHTKLAAPFRIVFSEKSSDIPNRSVDFRQQIELLRNAFNPNFVSVESYIFKDLTLKEQMEIASQTSIFITGCGGGSVTAMFLPKQASVLIYYKETGGVVNNKYTNLPARLDWDLYNNLAYLRVHWFPRNTMDSQVDSDALLLLVKHELDGILRENSYDYWF